jgi:hypothetical protein
MASGSVTNATIARAATMVASATGQATVTNANLTNTPAIDADVAAYFLRVTTAGGSLTTTEQNAIKTLVANLKANGVWDNMIALYPMVGSSAEACAQNLKSASFTGQFFGTWTFASTGAKPNGTNAYMATGLAPNTSGILRNDVSIGYYGGVNIASNGIVLGSNNLNIYPAFSSQAYIQLNHSTFVATPNTNHSGFIFGSRLSSTSIIVSIRGNITTVTVTSNMEPTSLPIVIGAVNQNSTITNYNPNEHRLSFIGNGLTNTEVSNYYTAVQAFQTSLNRQINP